MRDISKVKGKIFRHFKGDLYLFEDIVINSETQEKMVLYRALYGECGLFVRPYDMFVEKVPKDKINPTGQKYRFEEITVESENIRSK
ncbi:MAG: DUF1653 domain-containing protein [Clostridium sp.]